jgi:putative ATP-binding cassette transporter
MELLVFLEKEAKGLDRRLLGLGVVTGILNLGILFALTIAAGKAVEGQSEIPQFVAVVLGLSMLWLSQGFILRRMTVIVEGVIEKVRLRILDKVRDSDLLSIENIGRAPLYNAVSTHATSVSQAAFGVFTAFTPLTFLCLSFLLILYVSTTAFLIVVGALALVLVVLKLNHVKIGAFMADSVSHDNKFVHGFGDLIDGFKELKVSSAKIHDFFEHHLEPLAAKAKDSRFESGCLVNKSTVLIASTMFIVLVALISLLPVLSPAEAPKLVKLTIFVVFIFGPLNLIAGVYPLFSEAAASIREIRRVEDRLDSIYEQSLQDPITEAAPVLGFETLRCTALAFSYRDERGVASFSLEPLDFELSAGEVVFITGGNGSGKSTFLKILVGLYPPASGTIAVNGVLITSDNRQSYRDLFSAIFSDFHLFDRVYGVKEVDQAQLRRLLEMTDLLDKTSIVDHQITSVNLSSGQRKRLALVLSLLEDKPILLLDEWAAEQDPPFRRKFYREILPWLKQQNKTVVAVTHDDDHYDVADRVLRMRFGNFVED